MNSRLQWDRNKIMAYLKEHFDKYKYILIVCICGLALACFPSAERGDEEARDVESVLTADVSALEAQLEEALSAITGVGRVTVVLTAKSSSQAVYAYDEDKRWNRRKHSAMPIPGLRWFPSETEAVSSRFVCEPMNRNTGVR